MVQKGSVRLKNPLCKAGFEHTPPKVCAHFRREHRPRRSERGATGSRGRWLSLEIPPGARSVAFQNQNTIAACSQNGHHKTARSSKEAVLASIEGRILCVVFGTGYFATDPSSAGFLSFEARGAKNFTTRAFSLVRIVFGKQKSPRGVMCTAGRFCILLTSKWPAPGRNR